MKRYLVLFTIIINFALSQSNITATVLFKNEVVFLDEKIKSISGKVQIIDYNQTITIRIPLVKPRTFNLSEVHSITNENGVIIWSYDKDFIEGKGQSSDLKHNNFDERNTVAFESISNDLNTIKMFYMYSLIVSILTVLATIAA